MNVLLSVVVLRLRTNARRSPSNLQRSANDADRNDMDRARMRVASMIAAVAAINLAITYANGALGDYPVDAGPTIDALLHGHVQQALASHPIMGALAVLIRV